MDKHRTAPEQDGFLKGRLQWLMFFRVVVASFFLGIAALNQLQTGQFYLASHLLYMYALIGSVYLLTFVYVFLLPHVRAIVGFTFVQILFDLLFITGLIFVTGGVNSVFSFMYSLSIISASILLYNVGGLVSATIASTFYALLVILQHMQIIAPLDAGALTPSGYSGMPVYYPVIINASAFYLVAFLSSFIAEQAKKTRLQLHRKQADFADLEVLYENIIQSINSGLITLDLDGRITTFNQAARQITGLEPAQVHLQPIGRLFPALQHSPVTLRRSEAEPARAPRAETLFKRQDGKAVHLGFSLSVLRENSGQEIGTIVTFQDLTVVKEMQDYIQRMDRLAAVGRLSAGIAHEIRNPLASISGSIQVLRKGLVLRDSDKRLMDIIVRESEHLSQLIVNFTQFAKPVKPEREPVSVAAPAREVVEIFKNSPEAASLNRITVTVPGAVTVVANVQQLKQVLWNVLINAAQAMDTDGGVITIEAQDMPPGFVPPGVFRQGREDGGGLPPAAWAEIVISDTGCGMHQAQVASMFDPFFTTRETGTGLGLSIVYKIIQEHGGTIAVKTQPGQGTRFSIYLPAGNVASVGDEHHETVGGPVSQ